MDVMYKSCVILSTKPCHPERKLVRKRQLEPKDLLSVGCGAKFQGESRSFDFAQDDTISYVTLTLLWECALRRVL